MYLAKQYLNTSKNNVKIKLAVSFNRNRTNWATNEPKKIGYQVTAVPVEIQFQDLDGHQYSTETSGAFTGFNDCLLEVERQSSKRLEKALEVLESKIDLYKDYFRVRGFEFID